MIPTLIILVVVVVVTCLGSPRARAFLSDGRTMNVTGVVVCVACVAYTFTIGAYGPAVLLAYAAGLWVRTTAREWGRA